MIKIRLLISFVSLLIVFGFGFLAIFYARGYRIEKAEGEQITVTPTGILSITSDPTAAQIYLNGELKDATNSTLSLSPGEYKLEVKKEGYMPWTKDILIQKEIVTPIFVSLTSSAPSLSPLTSQGVTSPVLSRDGTRLIYGRIDKDDQTKTGLWVYDLTALPLGFTREPRQITDISIDASTWEWSANGQEILITNKNGTYLIDVNEFTSGRNLTPLTASKITEIKAQWEKLITSETTTQINLIQKPINETLVKSTINQRFSPDKTKLLYEATQAATIAQGSRQLPGSSTQAQEREIKPGRVYVYDIKEDRNFRVGEKGESLIKWMSNSHNLAVVEKGKISVMDYDSTNKQTVFSGNFLYPYVFTTPEGSRILVTTSLGADRPLNLYWLVVR